MMRKYFAFGMSAMVLMTMAACADDEKVSGGNDNEEARLPEWYYAGGELGTFTTSAAFEQPAKAVE
ncbi:MAG: hypothetical protein K2F82_07855, partial [Muribaculaceae bacterium]|nr:hypothetical protein [Muribaculaceae bacterium]